MLGTIAIAKEYGVRPRTKHINVKYSHFAQFMKKHHDVMQILWIKSEDQIADIFTKPLGQPLHKKSTINLLRWDHEDNIQGLDDTDSS